MLSEAPSAAVIAATRDAEAARARQTAANRDLAEAVALVNALRESDWLMARPGRAAVDAERVMS